MIASLRGTIQEKSLERVVVEVGGVGYLVHVSMQTLAELPSVGETVNIRCYTHVREDTLQIYGFLVEEEQKAFELLILVSGIGPKLALTILSGMSVKMLISAIAASDHRTLQTIPGVGKKTAERVIVELKDRCAKLELSAQAQAPALGQADSEVVEALINLGYKRNMAEKAVKRVKQQSDTAMAPEKLLRAALSTIADSK